jgi:hypothetical protein
VPAWISLNRDGLALVSGPEAYSFPTGLGTPAVRLSFVDAVRARIRPAVLAGRARGMEPVVRLLATVLNRVREEHYHLVSVTGGEPAPRDLAPGEALEWVRLADLPTLPVWPKRLAWRLPGWAADGWPDPPPVLADTIRDLHTPCDW